MAEPLGVLVLACFTVNMNKGVVESMLAAVGGIMAFLALHELLPLAIEHAGRKAAVLALFVGMAVMSGNLYLLDHWIGEGTH
jgi:zinc transporter, ZIP family